MKQHIFILIITMVFVLPGWAQQCEPAKEKAKNECSPSMLDAAKKNLEFLTSLSNNALSGGTTEGTAKSTQSAKDAATGTKAEVDAFLAKCMEAIKKCADDCKQEMQQKLSQTPVPDTAGAQQAQQKMDYCTKEEPQKTADEAKKTSGDLGEIMKAMSQLLAALMGQQKDQQEEKPGCDDAEYKRANVLECNVDKAETGSNNFVAGEYRKADGNGSVDDAFIQGEPAAGQAAQQQTGPASATGIQTASLPGGGSSAAVGSKEKDKGSNNAEGGISNKAGGYLSGSGGGGRGYGGGGVSNSNGNGSGVVGVSSADKEKIQNAVAANLAARNPASGPPGGISGPLSADNFQKVERRVETERGSLNEL